MSCLMHRANISGVKWSSFLVPGLLGFVHSHEAISCVTEDKAFAISKRKGQASHHTVMFVSVLILLLIFKLFLHSPAQSKGLSLSLVWPLQFMKQVYYGHFKNNKTLSFSRDRRFQSRLCSEGKYVYVFSLPFCSLYIFFIFHFHPFVLGRPHFGPRSYHPLENYPVQFPLARPSSENLNAICFHGDHRPRYPKSYFPQSGYGQQKRMADAVNMAEAWFETCCKHNQTEETDREVTLCCVTQAVSFPNSSYNFSKLRLFSVFQHFIIWHKTDTSYYKFKNIYRINVCQSMFLFSLYAVLILHTKQRFYI